MEYKPWLIFDVSLPDSANRKISAFVSSELERASVFLLNPPSRDEVSKTSGSYCDLENAPATVPPRLLAIDTRKLDMLPTELVNENWYTLGDSVGGISLEKPPTHNAKLATLVNQSSHDILFSPGLLCRIRVPLPNGDAFIFQLAEKNLRTKGVAFYKPIGGHLKYKSRFKSYINDLSLKVKGSTMPQDEGDVSFYVSPTKFERLRTLVLNDINKHKWDHLIDPIDTLQHELLEELGPVNASDGISLLSREELEIAR
ncbi:hypothetical protein [Rhizobium sp. ZPR3]|uniref:Uncharacterized protein n=1 Tax=Rhizobium sp. ZPR3 TaxID=3158967 RepID=A0AAU7RUV3_9HYPH